MALLTNYSLKSPRPFRWRGVAFFYLAGDGEPLLLLSVIQQERVAFREGTILKEIPGSPDSNIMGFESISSNREGISFFDWFTLKGHEFPSNERFTIEPKAPALVRGEVFIPCIPGGTVQGGAWPSSNTGFKIEDAYSTRPQLEKLAGALTQSDLKLENVWNWIREKSGIDLSKLPDRLGCGILLNSHLDPLLEVNLRKGSFDLVAVYSGTFEATAVVTAWVGEECKFSRLVHFDKRGQTASLKCPVSPTAIGHQLFDQSKELIEEAKHFLIRKIVVNMQVIHGKLQATFPKRRPISDSVIGFANKIVSGVTDEEEENEEPWLFRERHRAFENDETSRLRSEVIEVQPNIEHPDQVIREISEKIISPAQDRIWIWDPWIITEKTEIQLWFENFLLSALKRPSLNARIMYSEEPKSKRVIPAMDGQLEAELHDEFPRSARFNSLLKKITRSQTPGLRAHSKLA